MIVVLSKIFQFERKEKDNLQRKRITKSNKKKEVVTTS